MECLDLKQIFSFENFEKNLIQGINQVRNKTNISKDMFLSSNLNDLTVKNKFCYISYSDEYFFDEKGKLKDDYFEFYNNIAKSDAGIIFTGGFYAGINDDNEFFVDNKIIQRFKDFVKEIHSFGAKIFMQIKTTLGRADENNKFLNIFNYSASFNNSYNNSKVPCARVSDGNINKIIENMSKIANFSINCNFDGILIDGSLFGFVGEISSPEFNKRQFGYYSDELDFMENLLDKILSNKKINIIYKFSIETYLKEIYGKSLKNISTVKKLKCIGNKKCIFDFLSKLISLGVDGFMFSPGTFETEFLSSPTEFENKTIFENIFLHLNDALKTQKIKNKFGNDVIVIGEILENLDCMQNKNIFFDVTNDILADNEFLYKIKSNLCYKNCIRCGYCSDKVNKYNSISCIINPNMIEKLENNAVLKKNIAVVGSGFAGINCALFLAKRGYVVQLFERLNQLNTYGKLKEIYGYNSYLKEYNEYIESKVFELEKCGKIKVNLNTNFNLKSIDYKNFSDIIIATGESERFSNIPGSVLKNVKNIYDVLLKKEILEGKRDIIINAKTEFSLSFAQYLLLSGKNVSIIIESIDFLLKLHNSKLTYYMYSLKKLGCKIYVKSKINKIEEDFVEIYTNSKFNENDFDSTILNLKSNKKYKYQIEARSLDLDLVVYEPDTYPNNTLYYELVNSNFAGKIFMIGNALYPCDMAESIKTAYFVAKNI